MKKNKIIISILVVVIILLLGFLGCFWFYKENLKAVSNQQEEVIFEVKQGQVQESVLQSLKENNLIRNVDIAKLYIKLHGLSDIKYGIFTLDRSWGTEKIVEALNDATMAKQDEVMITFKEGMWAKDIAKELENKLGVSQKELLSLWNDTTYLQTLIKKYDFLTDDILQNETKVKLEGFLFPETYVFRKDASLKEITETFLDHFQLVYERNKADFDKNGKSIYEIITLASMVQYEASTVKDMGLVAGVFENRLAKGMKLESSVSVCYSLYDDLTSGEDCEIQYLTESPYNTYLHEGLPIGPILNPGEDAIKAALNPTKNDYLYFVADIYGDGSVYYVKTYDEQLKNQEKFNLNK